ncbi:hypothetical protein CDAR_391631 [Caerostris darwini]|uniref:Uncharacterized protein n=1 Tax=Caerostris darwini TaxID=1538125 RepID=A0AAV4QJZ0_9ARAC|nr:hypothetical protein CDAR_391631 [Caerostris darwini]
MVIMYGYKGMVKGYDYKGMVIKIWLREFSADEEVILVYDGFVVVIIATETNESRPVVEVSGTVLGRDGRFPEVDRLQTPRFLKCTKACKKC